MPNRPQRKKNQPTPAPGGAPRRPATSRARALALAAIVLLAAIVPFARTVHFGFVWDDPFLIGLHLDVHGFSDVARIWSTPFDSLLKDTSFKRTYFRPLTLFSLAADRAVSGDDPSGFHRTNVVLYGATCLFLWLLAWELSGRPAAAAAGAVLYALHPTHPESVAFVSGRTDVLSGLFVFASLWAAARYGPRARTPWRKLLPAALLLTPGLFAKEVAVFAVPLLPLALWLRDRRISGGDLLRASGPVAAAAALFLACRYAVLGPTPLPTVTPVEGAVPQILTSIGAVARYVPLLLFPLHLSARHEVPPSTSIDPIVIAGALTLLALAAGLAVALRRRSPWALPLGLVAATLLPVCYVRLLSGAIVAERFLFVPGGAIALAVALAPGALGSLGSRGAAARGGAARDATPRDASPAFLVACGVLALALATLLVPRVTIWKDEGTLFLSMLRDSPESPHVHAILGGYYYKERDLPRSAYHYRRAIALDPSETTQLLLNLAAAEDEMGEGDSAVVHIRRLNALAPEYGPGWYALGNFYVRVDRPDSAAAAYERALRFMPAFPQAENNLGAVLERQGRYDEALAHYRRALREQADYREARNNLTRLSKERGVPFDTTGSAP
ncbi:MAG: tetratricopeptide repeat protein [Hyphomicrobiales bacterium]